MNQINIIIESNASTYTNQHLYLLVLSLILNEPAITDDMKSEVDIVLSKLQSEEIIYSDSMLYEYETFDKFS